jgi:phage terminase large subunit GpA-like protein
MQAMSQASHWANKNADAQLKIMLHASRAPMLRSYSDFATKEVRCPPSSMRSGLLFDLETQPYVRLLFEEFERDWEIRNIVGCTQSGKTLSAFCIPVLYHLFERKESVLCGVPSADIVKDKWNVDLLPAIESCPSFRKELPRRGPASEGGTPSLIKFRHGPVLKFMTGGGDDKTRSHFTSRVLIITETDGFDEKQETSREGDKLSQLYGRTKSRGSKRVIYQECTVSTEKGRTWSDYNNGSQSKIHRPCPKCGEYVCPGREQLIGWREAKSELEAYEKSRWSCPICFAPWEESERIAANQKSVLVHRWQQVDRFGRVTDKEGMACDTKILGFRWTGVDNSFRSAGDIGMDEWKAEFKEADKLKAEITIRQQDHTEPAPNPEEDLTSLDYQVIAKRQEPGLRRGTVPEGTDFITVGIDMGKWRCYWNATAWRRDRTGVVINYGVIVVPTDAMGMERGQTVALREFREEVFMKGWPDERGQLIVPKIALVDAGDGNMDTTVHAFCNEPDSRGKFYASKGHGISQEGLKGRYYDRPAGTAGIVAQGEKWRLQMIAGKGQLLEFDADHWKSWLHGRLAAKMNEPGSIVLFETDRPTDHYEWSRSQCSERAYAVQLPGGKGQAIKWDVQDKRHNHDFDAMVLACVGAGARGFKLFVAPPEPQPPIRLDKKRGFTNHDGRPFLVTER